MCFFNTVNCYLLSSIWTPKNTIKPINEFRSLYLSTYHTPTKWRGKSEGPIKGKMFFPMHFWPFKKYKAHKKNKKICIQNMITDHCIVSSQLFFFVEGKVHSIFRTSTNWSIHQMSSVFSLFKNYVKCDEYDHFACLAYIFLNIFDVVNDTKEPVAIDTLFWKQEQLINIQTDTHPTRESRLTTDYIESKTK